MAYGKMPPKAPSGSPSARGLGALMQKKKVPVDIRPPGDKVDVPKKKGKRGPPVPPWAK